MINGLKRIYEAGVCFSVLVSNSFLKSSDGDAYSKDYCVILLAKDIDKSRRDFSYKYNRFRGVVEHDMNIYEYRFFCKLVKEGVMKCANFSNHGKAYELTAKSFRKHFADQTSLPAQKPASSIVGSQKS